MKHRLISSIGLVAVFIMCIIPPISLTVGSGFIQMPSFNAVFYGILNFAVFFASLAGVVIFIMLLMKESIIPVFIDWVAMIISVLFVLLRFINFGFAAFYLPATWVFLAGSVISLIFLLKYRSSCE